MLSFSDSRSFSVSGLSAYSNFSAYESSVSQAGGTFKVGGHVTHKLVDSYSVGRMEIHHVQVYEDSCCADQASHVRPSGKQSLRTSRTANHSHAMDNTNQGSFQVYEDSMQSLHGSAMVGENVADPEVPLAPAVAEQLGSGEQVVKAVVT